MTTPSDLIKDCLLENESVLWHRVVAWRDQRYGWLISWLGAFPVATIAIGLLVLYSINASFTVYSIFLLVVLGAFSAIVASVYSRGMYNDAYEAISDRRIIFVQNLSGSLTLTSVMISSIVDMAETVRFCFVCFSFVLASFSYLSIFAFLER
jgi:hypothetical protein